MVLGNIYVGLTQPMPDVSTQVFSDMELKGVSSRAFKGTLGQIKTARASLYNESFSRGKLSAKINMAFYVGVAVIIGLYNYFHTSEDERDFFGQMGTPLVISLILCSVTWLWNFIEPLAMYGYRSILSQLLTQCGTNMGDHKALRDCFTAYRANQARLRAAAMQAEATEDAGLTIANALRR